jgi:hypothetical protein
VIHRLNEYGLAVWRHKTKPFLFAQRAYDWVDRIVLIDESDGVHRTIVDDVKFSTFDFTDWIAVTHHQYTKVKAMYREIYE